MWPHDPLSPRQVSILKSLVEEGPSTPSRLAIRFGHTDQVRRHRWEVRSSACLTRLVREGILEKHKVRIKEMVYSVTEKGLNVLKSVEGRQWDDVA